MYNKKLFYRISMVILIILHFVGYLDSYELKYGYFSPLSTTILILIIFLHFNRRLEELEEK